MLALLKQRVKNLLRGEQQSWRDEVPTPILRHVPDDKPLCVVDIGAYDGDFTRALTSRFRVARALMIEALPHKVKKLRAEFVNPKYTVVECAASDRDGIVDFEMNEIDETSSLLKIRRELPELSAIKMGKATTLSVQARTLDGIAGEAGICEIDLLKIDVQGAELKVLAGAPMTLPRTRFVWMEVSFKPLYENSATFFEMYEQMQRHGFGLLDMTCAFRAPNKEMLQANGLFFRK